MSGRCMLSLMLSGSSIAGAGGCAYSAASREPDADVHRNFLRRRAPPDEVMLIAKRRPGAFSQATRAGLRLRFRDSRSDVDSAISAASRSGVGQYAMRRSALAEAVEACAAF